MTISFGREVVFVDPLDSELSYWWPALVLIFVNCQIVPENEYDGTMGILEAEEGKILVKYFEDNK